VKVQDNEREWKKEKENRRDCFKVQYNERESKKLKKR
jgi:hypothetical protein